MQAAERTILSVKPNIGTDWPNAVGLPAGTKVDLVSVGDKQLTVAFRSDMLDLHGVMHYAGDEIIVNPDAFAPDF